MTRQAQIKGHVEYREGDGPQLPIPPGPCECDETELDVTISWQEGDTRGATAIPMWEFERYLAEGAIELHE